MCRTASLTAIPLLCIFGSSLLLSGCDAPQAVSKPMSAPPPEVGIQVLAPHAVTITTELSGRTSPYLIAEVRPQVSGIIQRRLFTEGGQIQAGQLLYRIDPASYQAAVESAKAALARDEASLTTAQLKVKRYQKLLQTKSVSREAYDDAVAVQAEARAVVAVSRAALKASEINLGYTEVRSPIAGRIGRSAVTAGALVTANQVNALATVQQLDPIYVDVNQSSAQLLRLKKALASGRLARADGLEASVELVLEDGSRYAHAGRMQFSEVTVSESTGTVTLRAVFPNPDGVLLPGMFVRAQVQEGIRQQAILAPQQAVSYDAKGRATALVLDPDGKVEQR